MLPSRHRCEQCGAPAEIHDTAVEDGGAVARHWCAEHGAAIWEAAAPRPTPEQEQELARMIEEYRQAPEATLRKWGHAR